MKKDKKLINIVTIFGICVFIVMLILVNFNIIEKNDLAIKQMIESIRTKNLSIFFIVITNLGSTIPVIIMVLGMILYILFKNEKKQVSDIKDIMMITIALVISASLFGIIKQILQRPRPEILDAVIIQGGYSFPSGHSTVAMTLYLTFMILFRKYIKNARTIKIANILCFSMIILIGFSRIYLGVHYVSDVIAGFSLGLVSTLTCYRIIYGDDKGVKGGENNK